MPKEAADTAQALISEIDNSSSLVHVNVRATYILGIISTVLLVFIVLLLPCICCSKKCKKLCRWCCNGCTSAEETRELHQTAPWGGLHNPSLRPNTYSLQEQTARQHCAGPQGPRAIACSSPADPTWVNAGLYPSVPSCPSPPHNTPTSSSEE